MNDRCSPEHSSAAPADGQAARTTSRASRFPGYAAELLAPLLAVLRDDPRLADLDLAALAVREPEARVAAVEVHRLLERAVSATHDELLGVRAASRASLADAGVVGFLMSSAESVGAAFSIAARYAGIVDDVLTLSLDAQTEAPTVTLTGRLPLPGPAEDFHLFRLVFAQRAAWPPGLLQRVELWLQHAPPRDPEGHLRRLGVRRIHFGARFTGLSLPRGALALPLSSSDRKLHEVLLPHAEHARAALGADESLTSEVTRVILEQFARGEFGVVHAARELCMHPRTLSRHLSREGTSFNSLLDDVRRRIAELSVARGEGFAKVAQRSGFTKTASFNRAFRRWTGMTPTQYRSLRRGDLRAFR